MKSGKAAGNDAILNEMIKAGPPYTCITKVVIQICNLILSSKSYPQYCGTGIITPIHKGCSFFELDNYRGVTVYSCLS
jgi:hypothetical protein